MSKKRLLDQEITKQSLPDIFKQIDQYLGERKQSVSVTLLGGIAIILQGFRERATLNFDIFPNKQTKRFVEVCNKMNIPVDIVSVVTTVDFNDCELIEHYQGNFLKVNSINPIDLIKTKLERFYKHDPEDINAIIESVHLTYLDFKKLVQEMLSVYVGNDRTLKLSALEIVERKYPTYVEDFEKDFGV